MDNNNQIIVLSASDVSLSEISQESNRYYMLLKMRMLSTQVNRNGDCVTEEFIDNIVANSSEYVGMPLCVDLAKLKSGDYRGLGHMQNRSTGEFESDQIGAFISFEKVNDEYGASLYGVAKIAKRKKNVCAAIRELFDACKLNFSFEISAGEIAIDGGVRRIGVSEKNRLIAMAIVSIPAYPEATALELAAEMSKEAVEEHMFAGTIMQAEIDMSTIGRRMDDALRKLLGDEYAPWHIRVLLFCSDCFIFYDEVNGITYKVEYRVENDVLLITDYYAVAFTRKEGNCDMELNEAMERIARLEAELDTAKNTTTELSAQVDTLKEQVEAAQEVEARCKEKAEEVEKLEKERDELKDEVASLAPYKAQVEQIEAEKVAAELKAKQDSLKAYAQKNGLDVEAEVIAEMVEQVNYEAIFAEIQKLDESEQKNVSASFVDIKVGNRYGTLLDRAQ